MNELTVTNNDDMSAINKALKAITRKHKKVSGLKTPRAYIKKKMGLDYVEIGYMKNLADKEYPGWSFTVVDDEYLYQEILGAEKLIKYLIYYKVHGRLKWYDCGVWREGDYTAAHRIQHEKKGRRHDYTDIGNDTKAAVTDCIKKALNVYMNICDDIYKNQIDEDVELKDIQVTELEELASKIDVETHSLIHMKIEKGEINQLNYEGSKAKLERLAENE